MRRLIPLFFVIILLNSCSSTKKSQTSSSSNVVSTSGTSVVSSADKDGSSYEKAMVVKAKNGTKGIAAEYKWLRENYPGYKLISQSLDGKGKKHYDVMHITTKEGNDKSFYFDITDFFGKS